MPSQIPPVRKRPALRERKKSPQVDIYSRLIVLNGDKIAVNLPVEKRWKSTQAAKTVKEETGALGAARSLSEAGRGLLVEVLALKHESRLLGQFSYPVSDSRKSQASSPWAKQHRV